MVPPAESLIFDLHGQLLRLLAERTGLHFQGLSQVSRRLRATGWITLPVARKLVMIDHAFNLIRHITGASLLDFTEHVDQVLINSGRSAQRSGQGVSAERRSEDDTLDGDGRSSGAVAKVYKERSSNT